MIEKWIFPTIIMTIVGGFYVTLIKMTENFYKPETIIPVSFFINAIMSIIKNLYDKVGFTFEKFSLGAGVTFGLTMYYFSKAVSLIQNPGAAVVVARAQVLLTYFGGILLFKSKFSLKKLAAIIVIILGAYFTVQGQMKSISNYDWLKYAIYACIWSSANDLFSKAALNRVANPVYLNIELISAAVTTIAIQYLTTKTVGPKKKKKNLGKTTIAFINKYPAIPFVLLIVFQYLMLHFTGVAFNLASNPAYPRSFFDAGNILITCLSSLLLEKGASLSKGEIVGIALAMAGAFGLAV